jgi:hypothetical protein
MSTRQYTKDLKRGDWILLPFPEEGRKGGIVGKGIPYDSYPFGIGCQGNGKYCIVPDGTMPPTEEFKYPYGCSCDTVVKWFPVVEVVKQYEKYILCKFVKHVPATYNRNEPIMGHWGMDHHTPEILEMWKYEFVKKWRKK